MTNNELSHEERLLRLYTIYSQDEYELIKALQNYLKFFSGLILATIGGAFFVFEKINDSTIKSLGLLIGGFFVIGTSFLGYNAARSNYRRQLESIVKRFKIECLLGLDNTQKYCHNKYMIDEPLILERYRKDFEPYEKRSSDEFIKERLKKGFMLVIIYYYSLTSIMGLLLMSIGVII